MASYTVKSGDTLSSIASRLRTTVTALKNANGITNTNVIRVGRVLQYGGGASSSGGGRSSVSSGSGTRLVVFAVKAATNDFFTSPSSYEQTVKQALNNAGYSVPSVIITADSYFSSGLTMEIQMNVLAQHKAEQIRQQLASVLSGLKDNNTILPDDYSFYNVQVGILQDNATITVTQTGGESNTSNTSSSGSKSGNSVNKEENTDKAASGRGSGLTGFWNDIASKGIFGTFFGATSSVFFGEPIIGGIPNVILYGVAGYLAYDKLIADKRSGRNR